MLDVHPIVVPQVNWVDYLNIAKKLFQFSITKSLDKAGIRPDNIAAYLVSIAEMQQEIISPHSFLRQAGGVLKHASFSFLLVAHADIIMELIQETPLHLSIASIDSGCKVAIMSGTLEQWKVAIINCCTELVTPQLRLLFDKCLIHFERMGLSPIWELYRKVQLPDSTFKLLEKK